MAKGKSINLSTLNSKESFSIRAEQDNFFRERGDPHAKKEWLRKAADDLVSWARTDNDATSIGKWCGKINYTYRQVQKWAQQDEDFALALEFAMMLIGERKLELAETRKRADVCLGSQLYFYSHSIREAMDAEMEAKARYAKQIKEQESDSPVTVILAPVEQTQLISEKLEARDNHTVKQASITPLSKADL